MFSLLYYLGILAYPKANVKVYFQEIFFITVGRGHDPAGQFVVFAPLPIDATR